MLLRIKLCKRRPDWYGTMPRRRAAGPRNIILLASSCPTVHYEAEAIQMERLYIMKLGSPCAMREGAKTKVAPLCGCRCCRQFLALAVPFRPARLD